MSNGSVSVFVSSTGAISSIFDLSSAQASNIFKVFANGNIGVGTSTPGSTLSLVGTSGVNPITISSSTGSALFAINQSGQITTGVWQGTVISSTFGGTGQNSSAWTGLLRVTAGTWATSTASLTADVSGILPILNGGTNSSTIGAAGSVFYSNGSSYNSTLAGSTGQLLTI